MKRVLPMTEWTSEPRCTARGSFSEIWGRTLKFSVVANMLSGAKRMSEAIRN